MEQTFDFSAIRPYEGEEVTAAAARLCQEELFRKAVAYIVPDTEAFFRILAACRTVDDFQMQLALPCLQKLVQNTSAGITSAGFSDLSSKDCYTYITNHRDITLDSAFLNVVLHLNGFDTCEIAIGDNLLIYPWIVDFVRLNKSFIVNRSVPRRQMLEVSCRLSAYIHHALHDKKQSVWIAQREGRSKNSDDRTQESLVKMFALSGGGDFLSNIRALNLVPVAISYEYDPCDYLKAKEMQLKRDDPDYKKQPSDDLANMATGIIGYKGRIHFEASAPINPLLEKIPASTPRAELAVAVGHIIGTACVWSAFMNRNRMPALETAVWDVLPRAISTAWLRTISPAPATPFCMSTAFSNRKLSTAGSKSAPTTGFPAAAFG